jgi:hypothetical protein
MLTINDVTCVRLINLLRGPLNIYDDARMLVVSVPPAGHTARADIRPGGVTPLYVTSTDLALPCLTNLHQVEYAGIVGVPDPEPGVLFVVPSIVRRGLPDRSDVVSPGRALRDSTGNVIGCVGLECG